MDILYKECNVLDFDINISLKLIVNIVYCKNDFVFFDNFLCDIVYFICRKNVVLSFKIDFLGFLIILV